MRWCGGQGQPTEWGLRQLQPGTCSTRHNILLLIKLNILSRTFGQTDQNTPHSTHICISAFSALLLDNMTVITCRWKPLKKHLNFLLAWKVTVRYFTSEGNISKDTKPKMSDIWWANAKQGDETLGACSASAVLSVQCSVWCWMMKFQVS